MQKKFLFVLFFIALHTIYIYSQQVINVTFNKGPENTIVVNYEITGAKLNHRFKVSLYMSDDGGKTYKGPLKAVKGDVGKNITGGQHTIFWDVFKEVTSLKGDITFDVRADVIELEITKRFFVGITGNISVPQTDYFTYGVTVGQTGKTGWYAALRLNQDFFTEADYNCNDEGVIDFTGEGWYEFDDKTLKPKFTVTAGLNFLVAKKLYVYAGTGYGSQEYLWHINKYSYPDDKHISESYASHEEYKSTGIQVEGGAMLRIGKVLVQIGASSLNFEYMSASAGLAYEF